MKILNFTIHRLKSFLNEIDMQKHIVFPFPHSKDALDLLYIEFQKKLDYLLRLDQYRDPELIYEFCTECVSSISLYSPLLGYIIRSTDDRNILEAHGPLWRLAWSILEPETITLDKVNTKLILSKEWNYTALIYSGIPDLPGFLFIALPAPESTNPLLIPLAGHELGHAIWNKGDIEEKVRNKIHEKLAKTLPSKWEHYKGLFNDLGFDDLTDNLFTYTILERVDFFTIQQAIETFCDFIGLLLFNESFLYAFSYLLSPKTFGERDFLYPNLLTRINYLKKASNEYSINIPDGYDNWFQDLDEPQTLMDQERLLFELADELLEEIVPFLIEEANGFIKSTNIKIPHKNDIEKIYSSFKRCIPAENSPCFASIINAGWKIYNDDNAWDEFPKIKERKYIVLNELLLKNIEVFEIEQILETKI